MTISAIFDNVASGGRIQGEEALCLFESATLLELSRLATIVRNRNAKPNCVSYVIDRNVNYTNICDIHCSFCAFHRKPGAADAYVLTLRELEQKAVETKEIGGTGFLLQGGVNTELSLDYYLNMVSFIRDECKLWVHGFSPVEIRHIAKISGLGLDGALKALKDAGLGSLPGGGAEILVDRIRQSISPRKDSSGEWLEVMDAAHSVGLHTTGTMMFGINETVAERVEHMYALRNQQDRALSRKGGGHYTAFSAWPFQSGNTVWSDKIQTATDAEYLRTIAIARIFLDNFPHIQSSWVTMGRKTGQMALHYGCDDMGSLMIEENVVASAGTAYQVNREEVEIMIQQAGFEPWQRDNLYNGSAAC